MPIRVLLALEFLQHALGGSDEAICHRLRTAFAVLYAWGLREDHADRSQTPCVLPETRWELRGRIDAARMDALSAIQAAAAMDAGRVSPAPLVLDPLPAAQGSQRVTEAITL